MPVVDVSVPVVECVDGVHVVRDDLVRGGTKMPVLVEALRTSWSDVSEIVFPASSEGVGQLALALACNEMRRHATIFVAHRRELSRQTRSALAVGAEIVTVEHGRYNVVQHRARACAAERSAMYLPPGFAHDVFLDGVAARARATQLDPRVVVVTVSSGALCRGLMRAWPDAAFIAVKVGMRPDVPGADVVIAPESYDEPARVPPPFPSARGQDAKAWRFVPRDEDGVVFWNIAA